MSGDWRTHIRWVVAHPTEPKVLLARRDGTQRLPEVERVVLRATHKEALDYCSLADLKRFAIDLA